jgi:hypothetical protein
LIRHVSFDIEFKDLDENDEPLPIPEVDASQFEEAIVADVMSMPEGLENWYDYQMEIRNVSVGINDETPWDHDDMLAAYQAGIRGMGSDYFVHWMAVRLNKKRNVHETVSGTVEEDKDVSSTGR